MATIASGALVTLDELVPSSPHFKHGISLRITGKLQDYDVETAVAVIVDRNASLNIDTQHLNLNLRIGSIFQFIGELYLEPDHEGDLLVVANVGDSRAVLATTDDDGRLVPVQLTVDLKPNLPRESERIMQSRGRVLSCDDEPGVYRVWVPTIGGPGLTISTAFGDYYIKDFGLISKPELTFRNITHRDQFGILATDGVWDVMSNQEAVSSTP